MENINVLESRGAGVLESVSKSYGRLLHLNAAAFFQSAECKISSCIVHCFML